MAETRKCKFSRTNQYYTVQYLKNNDKLSIQFFNNTKYTTNHQKALKMVAIKKEVMKFQCTYAVVLMSISYIVVEEIICESGRFVYEGKTFFDSHSSIENHLMMKLKIYYFVLILLDCNT